MRKLLRPRDYLLLTFGFLGDAFEEVKDPFHLQEEGYKYLYGWVPHRWKRHNFERAVRRMLKTGDIEKVVVRGQAVIRLTSHGEKRLVRDFPLFALSQKPWDGWWRMVSFDIPEKLKGRRESLRQKIERLGMGRLQESLYITPFDFGLDLQEFVKSHELSDHVIVFEARHTFGKNSKDLAWQVWQLEKLEDKYKVIMEAFTSRQLNREERFSLQAQYEEVILADPFLPKELLPGDWIGFRVRKLIMGK